MTDAPRPTLTERLTELETYAAEFQRAEADHAALCERIDDLRDRRNRALERMDAYRPAKLALDQAHLLLDRLLQEGPAEPVPPGPANPTPLDAPEVHEQPAPAEEPLPAIDEALAVTPVERPDTADVPIEEGFTTVDGTPMTLPADPVVTAESVPADLDAPVSPSPGLGARERILEYVASHPDETARQIGEALGLPLKTAANAVSRLVAAKRLESSSGDWPPTYRLFGNEPQATVAVPAPAEAVLTVSSPPSPVRPAETVRDAADRKAVSQPRPTPAVPPRVVKPVTEAEERAVLEALIARPNGQASPALLSGRARLSTARVEDVLEHLATQGVVRRPAEGGHLWSRA